VVERAVYRHEDPERPVASIQFDPFQSPWLPGEEGAAPVPTGSPTDPAPAPAAIPAQATDDLRGAVNAYEKALLEEALGRHRFNQRATAAALGLSYDQLRHAMKRHKLQEAPAT
jgi:psp operon transcriptional activator